MTNGDKIRAMTDEEMATLLAGPNMWARVFFQHYCVVDKDGLNPGFCDDDCRECIVKWLKEEAENEYFGQRNTDAGKL